jgi:hypothetical protein
MAEKIICLVRNGRFAANSSLKNADGIAKII